MIDYNLGSENTINQINSNNNYLSNWLDSEIEKINAICNPFRTFGTINIDYNYRLFKTHNFLKIKQI